MKRFKQNKKQGRSFPERTVLAGNVLAGKGAYGVRAKKSLGQNFLTNKKVVEDIIAVAELKQDDIVLEIGPGKGFLTEALLKKVSGPKTDFSQEGKNVLGQGRVIAIEKDGDLVDFLREKFKKEIADKKLILVHGDILKFDPIIYKLKTKNYKIVANIPYYITGRIFREFLTSDIQPSLMILMAQKEVAYRILGNIDALNYKGQSGKGKESILSISVKSYGQPEVICDVSSEYFSPKPKVDSAVIKISRISKNFFIKNRINEDDFFTLVKLGFANKRKVVRNNLKLKNTEPLLKCGISEKARAENLTIENWVCLLRRV